MTGWHSRWVWCGLPEKRTTCRPFGFSRVQVPLQDGFWVRWVCHVSLRKKRDSQARYFARLVLIWPRLETNWTHYWSYLVLLLISPATDSNGGKDKSMQWCWPSHQETNKKTIDKENTKIPNLVSSKETKPLKYEHMTHRHCKWHRLGFASSTILKNAKYVSLKVQRGTISRRFSEVKTWIKNITNMVLECLLWYNWLQLVHFKR
jgi:hypothetical protein